MALSRTEHVNRVIPARVHEIFIAALERPPHLRDEFLRQTCGVDTRLLREVSELLDLHSRLESETRLGTTENPDPLVDSTFGAYRVLRVLGTGGMGRVYLAARSDGAFDRNVAIKVIDPQAVDPRSISRFEAECQILASLQHPSIATLFDAARGADGRLFIVMEYVDGLPITTYCERHNLSLHARVALFVRVCEAVSVAHQNLIVHRDLKPANVLVNAEGTPKLLDFGIVKRLTKGGREESALTDPRCRPATPGYASPEQLAGRPVHTGMDVFALGIILQEILTGCKPESQEVSAAAAAPQVSNSSSTTRLADTQKARSTATHLNDDLAAIVSTALEASPLRRYASVEAFARDLKSWLDHRPVSVRAQTHTYRAGKFLRRNRALSMVAATAVAATALAVVSLVWLWEQENRERAALSSRTRLLTFPAGLDPSSMTGFTVSPDGHFVVIGAGKQLWLWHLDSLSVSPLAGTEGAGRAFWSPDSRLLGLQSTACCVGSTSPAVRRRRSSAQEPQLPVDWGGGPGTTTGSFCSRIPMAGSPAFLRAAARPHPSRKRQRRPAI
jgi:serine/threonine protein kinase